MPKPKNPLGPIGVNVQQNVKRLREQRRLSLAELSRRLKSIGREIPTLGLSRIESGARRVDADDLVALGVALGVSPVTLLLPSPDGQEVGITDQLSVPADSAWRWMHGETELPDAAVRGADFREENRPYEGTFSQEVRRFVNSRVTERPYVIEVASSVHRPEEGRIALYLGEAAVKLLRERSKEDSGDAGR